MKVNHATATAIEFTLRRVFGCERFDFYGDIDADHLENDPFSAAYMIFSPLYLSKKISENTEDVSAFFEKYQFAFTQSSDTIDKEFAEEYSKELQELAHKYYSATGV